MEGSWKGKPGYTVCNLAKWSITVDDDVDCECEKVQIVAHLVISVPCPSMN